MFVIVVKIYLENPDKKILIYTSERNIDEINIQQYEFDAVLAERFFNKIFIYNPNSIPKSVLYKVWLQHRLIGVFWLYQLRGYIKKFERICIDGDLNSFHECVTYIYCLRLARRLKINVFRVDDIGCGRVIDLKYFSNMLRGYDVCFIGIHPDPDSSFHDRTNALKESDKSVLNIISDCWGRPVASNNFHNINLGMLWELNDEIINNMGVGILRHMYSAIAKLYDLGVLIAKEIDHDASRSYCGDMGHPLLLGFRSASSNCNVIAHSRITYKLGRMDSLKYMSGLTFKKNTNKANEIKASIYNAVDRFFRGGGLVNNNVLIVLDGFYINGVPSISQEMVVRLSSLLSELNVLSVDVRSKRAKQELSIVREFFSFHFPRTKVWIEAKRTNPNEILNHYRVVIFWGSSSLYLQYKGFSGVYLIPSSLKPWMRLDD